MPQRRQRATLGTTGFRTRLNYDAASRLLPVLTNQNQEKKTKP